MYVYYMETQRTLHLYCKLSHITTGNMGKLKRKRLYWCVAYLPSEASIIEHWTLYLNLS
jgi:hypothetical protein